MKAIPVYLKNTLRSLRVKNGYSQKEAAMLLGISDATLRNWERNAEVVPMPKIPKVAEVYHTPQEYIFFGRESAFSEVLKKRRIT
ncbi:helix-turn-helix domain-containing protein [Paenibacillus pabuli]|uniref:helix-turn-helix domain-containing protein n=1 Tax=Paenibacillus pabuli TaxID=1472 RepID=UPI001FFF3217|nr:helix-turn-helix transcriptional regulator [Paenibacillus pabuli]UPK45738.1 helix-turn-helix transcriptional regulator [Paenibacillus pabuli]